MCVSQTLYISHLQASRHAREIPNCNGDSFVLAILINDAQEFSGSDAETLKSSIEVVVKVRITEHTFVFVRADFSIFCAFCPEPVNSFSQGDTRWVTQNLGVHIPTDTALRVRRRKGDGAERNGRFELQVHILQRMIRLAK